MNVDSDPEAEFALENLDIISTSCMAVFMAARRFDGVFRPFWPFFALLRVLPELSAIVRSPRWRRVLCHRGPLHNFILRACRHMTSFLKDRVENNNNNNNNNNYYYYYYYYFNNNSTTTQQLQQQQQLNNYNNNSNNSTTTTTTTAAFDVI